MEGEEDTPEVSLVICRRVHSLPVPTELTYSPVISTPSERSHSTLRSFALQAQGMIVPSRFGAWTSRVSHLPRASSFHIEVRVLWS